MRLTRRTRTPILAPTGRRPKYGERDQCARCDLEIEYIGSRLWHDRGGNTTCHVTLRHHPGATLMHIPYSQTEDCGQCGERHPRGYAGECRDDRYRF